MRARRALCLCGGRALLFLLLAVALLAPAITTHAQETVGNMLCDNDDGHMVFDASVKQIIGMSGAQLPLANNSFSIAMWVQRRALSAGVVMTLMSVGDPALVGVSNAYLTLNFEADDSLSFAFNANNLVTNVASYSPPTYFRTPPPVYFKELNDWMHLTFTYSSLGPLDAYPPYRRCIYLDGVALACHSATSHFLGSGQMMLGASASPGGAGYEHNFVGAIDEVKVYQRTLGADEVLCLATAGSIANPAPILHWRFYEQSGFTVADVGSTALRKGYIISGPLTWERLPGLPVCLQQSPSGSLCSLRASASYILMQASPTQTHVDFEPSVSGSLDAEGILAFDGTSYMDSWVSQDMNYNPTTAPTVNLANEYTWAFWVYLHTTSTANTIMSGATCNGCSNYGFDMSTGANGAGLLFRWIHPSCSMITLNGAGTVQAGAWVHLAWSWNGATYIRFSINGYITADSGAACGAYSAPSASRMWTLGRNMWNGYPALVGKIASFTMWNSQLSPNAIIALASSPPLSLVPHPVHLANRPWFQIPGSTSAAVGLVPGLTTALQHYRSLSVLYATPSTTAPVVPTMAASMVTFTVAYSVTDPQVAYVLTQDVVGRSKLLYDCTTQVFTTEELTLANTLASADFTLNLTRGTNPRNYAWGEGNGSPDGLGFVVLDGASWLDLFDARDVGGPASNTFPTVFSGIYQGFSIEFWLRWEAPVDASFFDATVATGSVQHRIYFGYSTAAPVGFVIRWNDFRGFATLGSLNTGVTLQAAQWNHIALTLDALGMWRVWTNGAVAYSSAQSYWNAPRDVTRMYAAIGRNYANGGRWTGYLAGFRMYKRKLETKEIDLLSSAPPSSIVGRVFAIGVPFSALAGSAHPAEITTDWVTGRPLRIDISVSPVGYSLPAFVTLTGTTSSAPVTITFPALPPGQNTSYAVTFTMSGDLAASYVGPNNVTVWPVTFAGVSASAAFTLDTSFQSLHAQWDGAVAFFDGSATPTSPYLSLSVSADTGAQTLPAVWGLDPNSYTPKGFAFGGWFYVWDKVTFGTNSFFQCTNSITDDGNMFHVWMPPNYGSLRYGWTQGTTQVALPASQTPGFGVVPLRQWFHLSGSLDVFGNFELMINGVSVPGITKAQTAAPLLTTRASCTINRDTTYQIINSYPHWSGAATGFQFFDRGVPAAELTILAQSPPPQVNANFTIVGLPTIGAAGTSWVGPQQAVQIVPSVIAGAPVTIAISVSPAASGYTTPTQLTFSPGSYQVQSVDLTLSALPAGYSAWVVSFTLSGPAAPFYTVPAPFTILQANATTVMQSINFDINTAVAPLHASWIAGARPGTGIAKFEGPQDHYLDLNLAADTQRTVAPTTMPRWGGPYTGWSFSGWYYWAENAASASLFHCSAGTSTAAGSAAKVELMSYSTQQLVSIYLTNAASGAALTATGIGGSFLPIKQWFSWAVSMNEWGQFQFAMNGNIISTWAITATNMQPWVDRLYCRAGYGSSPATSWSGQIASFSYWSRPLIPAEMAILANTPPQNLIGGFTFVGMPYASLQATTYPSVSAFVNLITQAGVSLNIAVSPAGYATPATITFPSGSSSSQSFILTLGTLPVGVTGWTITCTVVTTPSVAGVYAAPAPFIIQLATIATLLSSADFHINTTQPSTNAGYLRVPEVNDGVVAFSGPGSSDFLNLNLLADTNSGQVVGSNWDPNQGFSVLMWVFLRALSASMVWFECFPTQGSMQDTISFRTSSSATTPMLRYYWYRDTTNVVDYTTTGTSLQSGQWVHIGLSVDPSGVATVYMSGAAMGTTPAPPASGLLLPYAVQRDNCFVGRDSTGTGTSGRFNGFVASVDFWNRALVAQEVNTLAGGTPPAVEGNFTFIGVPYAADHTATNTLPGLTCRTNLITSFAVTLNIFVSGGGYTTPASLTFSSTAPGAQTLVLTLPPLTGGATTWTISFTVTSQSASYVPPADMIVRSASIVTTLDSAALFVNTSKPSIHASWAHNVVYFDGLNTLSGDWIDLNQPADVNSGAVMPVDFGGLYSAGWGFSTWIYVWESFANSVLFQCSKALNDNADIINFYFYSTTSMLYMQVNKVNTQTLPVTSFSVPLPVRQWVSLTVSQDGYGRMWLWVSGANGVNPNPIAANADPTRIIVPGTLRTYCAINQHNQDTSTARWSGALASFHFFTRTLAAAEAVALASVVPSNIVGNVTFAGMPPTASYSTTVYGVLAVPSLVTNQPLTLGITVSPAGSTVPNTITWQALTNGPASFDITLLPLTPACNCSFWTVSFSLSGPAAVYFQTPPPMVIYNDSYTEAMNTRTFFINTDGPSVHASWKPGAAPGTGIAYSTYGSGYLDVSHDETDSRNGVMPVLWGVADVTMQPQGFAFAGWTRIASSSMFSIIFCYGDSYPQDYLNFRISSYLFNLYWYRGTSTGGSYASIAGLPPQWHHWLLSFDAFGTFTVYVNGRKVYGPVPQATTYPLFNPRSNCYIGRDQSGNPQLNAEIASWAFWNRTLNQQETSYLASNPPLSIQGELTILGVNRFQAATGAVITPITMTTSLICAAPVTVSIVVTPSGSMTPSYIEWYAAGPVNEQTFSITLAPLTGTQGNWTIRWVLSGAGAKFFKVPDPMVIYASNYAGIMQSALFNLNTFGPPQHAGWEQTNAVDGNGIVLFDAPGTQWLDLQMATDTNNGQTMPLTLNVANGFSVGMWFWMDVFDSSAPLFECTSAYGSSTDRIRIGTYTSQTVFQFLLYGGVSGTTSLATMQWGANWQLQQWTHILLTVDEFAVMRFYLHGLLVGSIALSSMPRTAQRSACYVGMDFNGGSMLTGNAKIAGVTFWERNLIASEARILAVNPPSNIVPVFTFVGMPQTGQATVATTAVTVFPSLMTPQPLKLDLAVTAPSYSTPPSFTWVSTGVQTAQSFTLQLLNTPYSYWNVTGTITANGVQNWAIVRAPVQQIQVMSFDQLQATVAWQIDMTRVPSHAASVSPGLTPGYYTYNFDPSSYLVLTSIADVGDVQFPLQAFDGNVGWTLSMWVLMPDEPPVATPYFWMMCTSNLGETVDTVYIGTYRLSTSPTAGHGFWMNWYYGTSIQNPRMDYGIDAPDMQWNTWIHVAVTVQSTGVWSLFANGVLAYSGTYSTIQPRVRNFCTFGASGTTATPTPSNGRASLGGMQYWERALQPSEVQILTNNPPPSIKGASFAVTMPPASGVAGDLLPFTTLFPGLVPSALSIDILVTGGPGFTTPSTLNWPINSGSWYGRWAPQTFTLTLTTFGASTTNPWVLSFSARGAGAAAVTPPANITIVQSSYAWTASNADFTVVSTAPSQHAGWSAGLTPGQGWLEFDGASQYLDLSNPLDTLSGAFPLVMPATTSGYSIGFWFKWTKLVTSSSNTNFLYCSSTPGSTVGEFFFGLSQVSTKNANGLRVGYRSTSTCLLDPISNTPNQLVFNVWIYVSLSQDGNGRIVTYINGVAVSGGDTTCAAYMPPATSRPYCMISRNSAQSSAHGQPFSLTDMRFWQRALAPSEMQLMAATVPASIGPVQFTVVNMPVFGQLDTLFQDIYVYTSVCTPLSIALQMWPFGTTSVPSVAWGSNNCGPKSFDLTTSNGNPTPTEWRVNFTITGVTNNFLAIPPAVLPLLTYDTVWRSAGVTVNASLPSLHAQRSQTATGGHVVSFLSAPSWIDLNIVEDTWSMGRRTMGDMPMMGGELGSFSVSTWLRWPSANPGMDGKIFSCSAAGSSDNEIYLAQLQKRTQLQYGFRLNGGMVCRGTFGTPSSLTPDQWNAIVWKLDPNGVVSFWLNGVQLYSQTCALANLPLKMPRPSCIAGMSSYDQRNQSTVSLSRYAYFPRNLNPAEIYTVAITPPPELRRASVTVLGVPYYTVDDYTVPQVRVSVGVCTGEPVTFTASLTSIGAAGNPNANTTTLIGSLTFGMTTCAPQSLPLTFPADSLCPRWMLSWTAAGVTAGVYELPAPFIIQRATYPNALASSLFNLNTSLPSAHAGWRLGAQDDTGIVTFDASAGQYLSLTTPADVSNDALFPDTFGGPNHAFAIDMWLQRPTVLGTSNAIFLQCSLDLGSFYDSFKIAQAGSSANFVYSLNLGDVPAYTSPVITALASEGWQHLLFRQDPFGVVSLYVNGNLAVSLGTQPAPNRATRASCTVGRQSFEPQGGSYSWNGNLAALRFWDRDVIPPEVSIIAANFPRNLVPSRMVVTGLPSLVMLNAELVFYLRPSTYWTTSLTVTAAVDPPAASINQTVFVFPTFASFNRPQPVLFKAPNFGTNITFSFTFNDPVHYMPQTVKTLVFLGSFSPIAPLGITAGGYIFIRHSLLPPPQTSVSLVARTPWAVGFTFADTTASWAAPGYSASHSDTLKLTAPFNAVVGSNVTICYDVTGPDQTFFIVPDCLDIKIIAPSSIIVTQQPSVQVAALLTTSIGFMLSTPPWPAVGEPAQVSLDFVLGHPSGGFGGGLVDYPITFTTANWNLPQFVTLQAPALAQNLSITLTTFGISAQQFQVGQTYWLIAITARLQYAVSNPMLISTMTPLIPVTVVGFPSSTPDLCVSFQLQNTGVATPAVRVVDSSSGVMCFQSGVPVSTRFFNFTTPSRATGDMVLVMTPVSGSDKFNFIAQTNPIVVQGFVDVSTPGPKTVNAQSTITVSVVPYGVAAAAGTVVVTLSSTAPGSFSSSVLTFANPTIPQTVQYTDNTITDGWVDLIATVTGGTAQALCDGGRMTLQVKGYRAPVRLVSTNLREIVGHPVSLSFTLSEIPYPGGAGFVQLNFGLGGQLPGDSLSLSFLGFDGSNWNTTQTTILTTSTQMHNVSVFVTLSGVNAYQYELGFPSPLTVTAAASFGLVVTPIYILAALLNSLQLQSKFFTTPTPNVCVGVDVVSAPSSICFAGGATQWIQVTAQPIAGMQPFTFSALSGLDAPNFLPYTVNLQVLGYIKLAPAPQMNAVYSDGVWNATARSDIVLRMSQQGLPDGDLTVQLSSNSSGKFSTTSVLFHVAAGTFTDFVYRDGSLLDTIVRIESKVTGGTVNNFCYTFSEIIIRIVAGGKGALLLTTSEDIQSGRVRPGAPQPLTLVPTAAPLPSSNLQVQMVVSGCASPVLMPPSGLVTFTADDWIIPQNLSVTSSAIGQTCHVAFVVSSPNTAYFDTPVADFLVLNNFAVTTVPDGLAFPVRVRASDVFVLSVEPFYGGAAQDVCVDLSSPGGRLSFTPPSMCFNTGAQQVTVTAPNTFGAASMVVTPSSGTVAAQFNSLTLSLDVLGYVVTQPAAGSGAVDLGNGHWAIDAQKNTPLTLSTVGLTSGTLQLQLTSTGPAEFSLTTLTLTAGVGITQDVNYRDGSLKATNVTITVLVTGGTVNQYCYTVSTLYLHVGDSAGGRIALTPYGALGSGLVAMGAPPQSIGVAPSAAASSGDLHVTMSLTCTGATGGSFVPMLFTFTQSNWFQARNSSLNLPVGNGLCIVVATPDDSFFQPVNFTFSLASETFTFSGHPASSVAGERVTAVVVTPTGGTAQPDMCVQVSGPFIVPAGDGVACFNGQRGAPVGPQHLNFTLVAAPTVAFTVTPYSGPDMGKFLPATDTLSGILGVLDVRPVTSAGLYQDAWGDWQILAGTNVTLNVTGRYLASAGSLNVSVSTNGTATLTPSNFIISNLASGGTLTFAEQSAAGTTYRVKITVQAVEGTAMTEIATPTATMHFAVLGTLPPPPPSSSTGGGPESSSGDAWSSSAAADSSSAAADSSSASADSSSASAPSTPSSSTGGAPPAASSTGAAVPAQSSSGPAGPTPQSSTGAAPPPQSSTAAAAPPEAESSTGPRVRPTLSSTGEADPIIPLPPTGPCKCDTPNCYMCLYSPMVAILLAPDIVTECDTVLLDARTSYGMGAYQPAQPYTFQLVSVMLGGIDCLQAACGLPGPPSGLAAWPFNLGADLGTIDASTGATVSILGAHMVPGAEYTFSLVLTNGISQQSDPTLKTVKVQASNPALPAWMPTAAIVPINHLERSMAQSWSFTLMENTCASMPADAVMSYSWTITYVAGSSGSTPAADAILTRTVTSRIATLPPYFLLANATYTIDLAISITSVSAGVVVPVQATAHLEQRVVPGKIVPLVSGSDRERIVSAAITLDASDSYDEDVNPVTRAAFPLTVYPFKFEWSCEQNGGPCSTPLTPFQLSQPQLKLTAFALEANYLYSFTLKLTPKNPADTRRATLTRYITTLPVPTGAGTSKPVPLVTIIHPPPIINPTMPFFLLARAVSQSTTPSALLTYQWTCSDASIMLQNTTAAGLSVLAGSMTPGYSYRWTVHVTDPAVGTSATAFTSVYAQPVPEGGHCTATPSFAPALEQKVTVSCTGWYSPIGKEPLRYSFRVLDSVSGPSHVQQLHPLDQLASPVASLVLPDSAYAVHVVISDPDGIAATTQVLVQIYPPDGVLQDGPTCYAWAASIPTGSLLQQRIDQKDLQAQLEMIMQLSLYLNKAPTDFGDSEPLSCAASAGTTDALVLRDQVRLALFARLLALQPLLPAGLAASRMVWQATAALTADVVALDRVLTATPSLVNDVQAMLITTVTHLLPSTFDLQMAAMDPTAVSPYTPMASAISSLMTAKKNDCMRWDGLTGVLSRLLHALSAVDNDETVAPPVLIATLINSADSKVQAQLLRGNMKDGLRSMPASHAAVEASGVTVTIGVLNAIADPTSSFDTAASQFAFAHVHAHIMTFAQALSTVCFPAPAVASPAGPVVHSGPLVRLLTSVDGQVSRKATAQFSMDNIAVTNKMAQHTRPSHVSKAVTLPGHSLTYTVPLDDWIASAASVPPSQLVCSGGTVSVAPAAPAPSTFDAWGLSCVEWNAASSSWDGTQCSQHGFTPDRHSVKCSCAMPDMSSSSGAAPAKYFTALYTIPIFPNGSCNVPSTLPPNITDDHLGRGNNTMGSVEVVDLSAAMPWFYILTGILYAGVALTCLIQFYRLSVGLHHGHPFRRWGLLSTHIVMGLLAVYRCINMAMLYSSLLFSEQALSFATATPHLVTLWAFILCDVAMVRGARKVQRNVIIADMDKKFDDEVATAAEMEDEAASARVIAKLRIAHQMALLDGRRTHFKKNPAFTYLRSRFMQSQGRFTVLMGVLTVLSLALLLWATGSDSGSTFSVFMQGGQALEGILSLITCIYYWFFLRRERKAVLSTSAAVLMQHRLASLESSKSEPAIVKTSTMSSTVALPTGAAENDIADANAKNEADRANTETAELREIVDRQNTLARETFEQSEPFPTSTALSRSGPYQALATLAFIISSLILLFAAGTKDPGVGFLNSRATNYAYVVFDLLTLVLILQWVHRVLLLPDEEERNEREHKYAIQQMGLQQQAAMYMAGMQSLGEDDDMLGQNGMTPLFRTRTMDSSTAWGRQASLRYSDIHVNRQSSLRPAGMAPTLATQLDAALVMGSRRKFTLGSPSNKSSAMYLPHVPEASQDPAMLEDETTQREPSGNNDLISVARRSSTDGVEEEGAGRLSAPRAGVLASPSGKTSGHVRAPSLLRAPSAVPVVSTNEVVAPEVPPADPMAMHEWIMFDDPSTMPPEPAAEVILVEQFDENGLPFAPPVYKRFVKKKKSGDAAALAMKLAAEARLKAELEERAAVEAKKKAAEEAELNASLAAAAARLAEEEAKQKALEEERKRKAALATLAAKKHAAQMLKRKAQEAAEKAAREAAEKLAAEQAEAERLMEKEAADRAAAAEKARAEADAEAARHAEEVLLAQKRAEEAAAKEAAARAEADAVAAAARAAAEAARAEEEAKAAEAKKAEEAALVKKAEDAKAAAGSNPVASPKGPRKRLQVPQAIQAQAAPTTAAPTTDPSASSSPPHLDLNSPDELEAARFEILPDGTKRPIRLDESGRPIEIKAGRRAHSIEHRGAVNLMEGGAEGVLGPEYRARTQDHVDAEIVGSLFTTDHRPAALRVPSQIAVSSPSAKSAISSPTLSSPTHGRRAVPPAVVNAPTSPLSLGAAMGAPSSSIPSARDALESAAARWKTAQNKGRRQPSLGSPVAAPSSESPILAPSPTNARGPRPRRDPPMS